MINRRFINAAKIGLIAFIVLGILLAILCSATSAVASSTPRTKYYSSIQIEEGDTLWDISSRNHVEGTTVNEYMDEICQLNGITKSAVVKAGDYLTIYYFK